LFSETLLSALCVTVEIPMSQIRTTLVSIVALIILYFIYTQARAIAAPRNITLVMALMAVLIIFNVARTWLRGY
jgi:chromate transport protein ChrA